MATYEFNLVFEVNNQKIQALQNFNNHKFNISAYNLAPDIHPTSCLHLKSTPPSTFPHIKLFGRGPNHQTQPKAESQIQNNFQDSEEKAKKKKSQSSTTTERVRKNGGMSLLSSSRSRAPPLPPIPSNPSRPRPPHRRPARWDTCSSSAAATTLAAAAPADLAAAEAR
jgi:hypothetical protein